MIKRIKKWGEIAVYVCVGLYVIARLLILKDYDRVGEGPPT
jgi:hypothetical protein